MILVADIDQFNTVTEIRNKKNTINTISMLTWININFLPRELFNMMQLTFLNLGFVIHFDRKYRRLPIKIINNLRSLKVLYDSPFTCGLNKYRSLQ